MSPAGSKNAPEAKAREKIDVLLEQAGWLVQYRDEMNLTAADAIAVCEFKLEKGHGFVDYLLFVDGQALGVVEAKPAGYSFTSVEVQAKKTIVSVATVGPAVWANDVRQRADVVRSHILEEQGLRGAPSLPLT